MTLPTSGTIAASDFRTEMLRAGQSIDMSWVAANTKTGQVPSINAMNGYYNKSYYQRNMDGNCNNGNCATAQGTAACWDSVCTNCSNCYNCAAVNCTNCDTQKWLQSNCNCSTGYNCNSYQYADIGWNCANCN